MLSKIFSTRKGRHSWPELTICEVHRQIYDLLVLRLDDQKALEAIIPLLEKAYVMGIKMTKKLVDYKLALPDWEKNDSVEAKRLRELRIHLENEISNNLQ